MFDILKIDIFKYFTKCSTNNKITCIFLFYFLTNVVWRIAS